MGKDYLNRCLMFHLFGRTLSLKSGQKSDKIREEPASCWIPPEEVTVGAVSSVSVAASSPDWELAAASGDPIRMGEIQDRGVSGWTRSRRSDDSKHN